MFKAFWESLQNLHLLEIVVTIAIFFLGLIFNKISESLKEKRRLNILRDYIFELIYLIKSQSDNQVKYIMNFSQELKKSYKHDFNLVRVTGSYIENFKKLDHQDIFRILVRRKKGSIKTRTKRFEEFLSAIDYFKDIYGYIFKYNEQLIDDYIYYKNEWNKNIEVFRNNYQGIIHKMSISPIPIKKDSFIQGIDDIFKKNEEFLKNLDPELGIKAHYEKIYLPIINHLTKYPKDPRTNHLLQPLLNAEHYYKEIETKRYQFRRYILLTGRDMIRYSRKMSEFIEIFKKRRIK